MKSRTTNPLPCTTVTLRIPTASSMCQVLQDGFETNTTPDKTGISKENSG